ncbi:MAG: bifunctional (p)ppGpp synthetase/guanosine-3',5'-bis(diphosphate) 3'-pyrophosphohydrolase [Methylomonas sp.]|nr:bifunctional (p)ppGpp synthetase/guanosine-3',5'-bis(diphosphate) 3'-pyrophosphohydrolase [Methylomonas sp.]PPD20329.1 MAG: bifunctional GTP diphosphokinase/guanosine-3',5'-bis(diphosphate) 3'-diphosphatase [Methylomonas sp.]PPD26626.1 MAG: bifunctional GTP diphosphokinase/guanosine-3',5'-bis(diphosphate) 3'-diphosphatase [Methylomonas sp.]PPD38413.1 MAG: bifunctional GTP diphosphokinase/guanosine-3',5'-bis(diphosphate) 3'-diphosphatase [Methylomonas sp.]PPD40430.1 MAG: bifunctional GTP diph
MTELAAQCTPPPTELPEDKLLQQLCNLLGGYLDPTQINTIVRAYHFGAAAHTGQFRRSGEAYICHPVSVAITLAGMRMDANGIMAAILHDVIEDTPITKAELAREFSPEVAELVDGVTKLSKIDSRSRAEAQAENVRKMFLAMAQDLRVIIVKLADRLHNMQTLGNMPPEKKRRIAKETLEIYAPIANRLGMNDIRHQLEALGFKAMYPNRYKAINNAVRKSRGHRKEVIDTIQSAIQNRLSETALECKVAGREKNIASIYQKMLNKKISFSDVFDVHAFRIFCHSVDDCYRALGSVHNLYKPIPGRFKDYIALPKANGYQSLHTTLMSPYGMPIEIQIRTHEMHRISESGIAAHWLYKSDSEKSDTIKARANEWLRDLLEIQKSVGDSLEFIDNLKVDLFPHEVFIFTPLGKIIKLPRGASIVDFAYMVHTDVGNACISARIDKKLVPLQTRLENGMTVEVITAAWARPNPLWLNYVVTAKARSCIRAYLKNFNQQEAIKLGRRLLEKELLSLNLRLEDIDDARIMSLLHSMKQHSLNELLEDIGLGNRMPFLVAKRLGQSDVNAAVKLEDQLTHHTTPLVIKGTEGMVVSLAKCCRPIPGDPIIGFFNPGKGIVVHHQECRNSNDVRKKQTTWLDVEWSQEAAGEFSAEIRIELLNQRGSLATIASTISAMESNIENITVVSQDERVSVDLLVLAVHDRVHLANIIRKLKKLSIVLKITRIKA